MTSPNTSIQTLPVLPIRTAVLFPGVVAPLEVGRDRSVSAVDAAEAQDNLILLVPQRDADVLAPDVEDLIDVGVVGELLQVIKHETGRYTVVVRALERRRVEGYDQEEPHMVARASALEPVRPDDPEELATLVNQVAEHLVGVLGDSADQPQQVRSDILDIEDPDALIDRAAAHIDMHRDKELAVLREADTLARLRLILPPLARLREVLRMKADIGARIAGEVSRDEREKVLRERKRAIQEELGEGDEDDALDEYAERITASKMGEEARTAAKQQVRRMRQMSTASPEYNVSRTYLETLLELPWGIHTEDTLDVQAARAILDADHSGLEDVKKRIVEFIAVRKLAPDKHGPILCLVGPPGVGKTSLGRSVATALDRKYIRGALGGVRDESEIRGHRRTYIGALPGRIATGLKKAGSMNPVFVLDEIDKLGSDHRGDPSSALLEVLDPEQNFSFVDHYLEVELDLSRVMFIATANQVESIPGPLLDRMEVIRVPGYTELEKKVIAEKHLLPKQKAEHGLGREQVTVEDDAIIELIVHYTREAGVRNLERELAALCRTAAVKVASGDAQAVRITAEDVSDILGPRRFFAEVADQPPQVGVATALAWTPTGGDILFVETRLMPGKGELKLTGQVGDVMRESAVAAMSWVRANAERLGISSDTIAANDLHIHVPSGAVRKDGPSAGITIVTALASLLENRPVHTALALSGELTLRGLVLPVGGVKEKVLAAHRAGIKTVVLPERNEKDLVDVPKEIREDLDIRLVKRIDEALEIALGAPLAEPIGAPTIPVPPTAGHKPGSGVHPIA